MSKRETFLRYSLIIKKLKRIPSTFNEISNYLTRESELQSYNYNISLRTFQRDLEEVRSLFNIDIKYNFSTKVYYIDDGGQSNINDRMLEAFDIFNALNISEGLSSHIYLEKRSPQGTESLYGLIHAIKNRLQIKFSYHKFWEDEISERNAEPYALKEFKNRWYVLSKDCKDGYIKTFALDRLTNLEISNNRFEFPAALNIEEDYRYCFGIINPIDEEPQEIILSFNSFQGKYIKTLPLHETQQVLIDNEEELRIKLKIFITEDFIMELLSYADKMKVVSPLSLINELKIAYGKALKQY